MPELNIFACDVCGAQKQKCNHWWIVWIQPIQPAPQSFAAQEFSTDLWERLSQDPAWPRAVACGEEHAQQLFARWLVSGSFEAPSARKLAAADSKLEAPPLPTPQEET
jgi:hypothetical protein